MRVLVIGGGGREHALVARLDADRDVGELLVVPGNPGIARLARTVSVDTGDLDGVLALTDREQVDLALVGPGLPLSRGIADGVAAGGGWVVGRPAAAAGL